VLNGEVSRTRSITASIIQGSGVGPATYIVTAGDLRLLNTDNTFITFVDDTYLVIPAAKVSTEAAEVNSIVAWAAENNLRTNQSLRKSEQNRTEIRLLAAAEVFFHAR